MHVSALREMGKVRLLLWWPRVTLSVHHVNKSNALSPLKGAVLGPGEFFEGLSLGGRQFVGGTLGKYVQSDHMEVNSKGAKIYLSFLFFLSLPCSCVSPRQPPQLIPFPPSFPFLLPRFSLVLSLLQVVSVVQQAKSLVSLVTL